MLFYFNGYVFWFNNMDFVFVFILDMFVCYYSYIADGVMGFF